MKKIVCLIVAMTVLIGCERQERKQVEDKLSDFTSLYPMEDLTEFYDLEGYRDEDFSEDDKGTWVITSGYSYRENGDLCNQSITIFFDRNKRSAEGVYYDRKINSEKNINDEIKVAIIYDGENFKSTTGEKLPEKIVNYRFLLQYLQFSESYLRNLETQLVSFDKNTEIASIVYKLPENDENLIQIKQQLKKKNGVTPTLDIEGDGLEGWKAHSSRRLQINFDNLESLEISESVSFMSSNNLSELKE